MTRRTIYWDQRKEGLDQEGHKRLTEEENRVKNKSCPFIVWGGRGIISSAPEPQPCLREKCGLWVGDQWESIEKEREVGEIAKSTMPRLIAGHCGLIK
jgi:hypothetical protein